MKKLVVGAIVLILNFFLITPTHALLVGTSQGGLGSSSSEGPLYSSIVISPWFSGSVAGDPEYHPFGDITIDLASVGSEWVADPATTDFANSVALLTNGEWDLVGIDAVTFGASAASGEGLALSGPGFSDPDFQGSTINRMTLQLTSFSSLYDPDFPVWGEETAPAYVVMFGYTITYEDISSVPEPSTIVLMGLGLASLAGLGRNKPGR